MRPLVLVLLVAALLLPGCTGGDGDEARDPTGELSTDITVVEADNSTDPKQPSGNASSVS